ncbi:MAG: peptidyl-prolyl cis-trans isomerase [Terriglobales bacterium]
MIRFLQTPGPIKKIVLGGLLTVICVLMVITLVPGFGSTDFFGGGTLAHGVVATVAGDDVTTQEVQREARQMLQQQFPQGGAQASMLLPYFARQAAENLIQRKVVLAEANQMGLHVTDAELRDELQNNPQYSGAFFVNGSFVGQTKYEEILSEHDLTVPQFEQLVRNQILVDKVRELIGGAAMVSDAEVQKEFLKKNSKVKFDYAVLRKDDLLKDIHPADAELKAYYDHNKANYANSIPEKRKISYVLLDTAQLEAQTPVNDQELQTYYDRHRDEFRSPDQVKVSQILIKTPLRASDSKVDPKALDQARAKADDVLKQLKAGAKFEDLAKKYSEDPSASSGGSIGWINHGGFPVPDVDKAAFSLPKGGTSGVINAGYAFVILHIDDKQSAHVKTLDEVRGQIESSIKQQKAAEAADSQANTLLSQAHADGLNKAAASKGLQVVNTDFISRTDSLPGIGSSPQFMDAVFGTADKSPPDEVQLPQGFAVFQVQQIQPASTPSFEEIRSRVENDFKNERAAALLTQKTRELADRAKADHDLKKAAKEMGASLKTSDLVLPDGQVPDIGSMTGAASVAFSLKPGEASGPINNGTTGVVLSVIEREEPGPQELVAKKDQIRESLLQSKQSDLFEMFVANAREQMLKSKKIKMNEQELKSLTGGQGQEGE